jgi:MFS family permease
MTSGESTSQPKSQGRVGALRSRNFRLLWTGLIIANSGSWMATTAEAWLVTDLEPDRAPLFVGIIALSFALPMIFLTMIGGAVADRFPRMRILWLVQIVYMLAGVFIAIMTLSGLVQVWMLPVYAFILGVGLAFDSPVRQSLLPDIVEKEHLAGAVSLNSASYPGAALIGPAIAGALIPLIGVGGVYLVAATSGLAVLIALRKMTGVPDYAAPKSDALPLMQSIREGVRFATDSRLIFGVLAISIVTGIFTRSYNPLLVIFAREEFQVSSFRFGLMTAAPGLGTLIAAFVIASRIDSGGRGRKMIIATFGLGFVQIAVAAMPWYYGALPLLMMTGALTTLLAANMATVIQLEAPPRLRGRLMSIYMLTLVGIPAFGTLLSGAVANAIGVRATVGGAAVITLIGVGLIFRRNDPLRTVD